MTQIPWLDSINPLFPPTEMAMTEPNGLLAAGGMLNEDWLMTAYRHGIFPWFSEGDPILWWSPSPRMVLEPQHLHLGRSTRKFLRKPVYDRITFDKSFEQVIYQCAEIERGQDGTWITVEMENAYSNLHESGKAHSVEVWKQNELIGGLYGVAIGSAFFGESMFSKVSGASKIAFIALIRLLSSKGLSIIDCQVHTQYLESFGATEIPRTEFEQKLDVALQQGDFSHQVWSTEFQFGEIDV